MVRQSKKAPRKNERIDSEKDKSRPRNVFDWPEFKGKPAEARKYIDEHGTYL